MDLLSDWKNYPENLRNFGNSSHECRACREKLIEEAPRLFVLDEDAHVDVADLTSNLANASATQRYAWNVLERGTTTAEQVMTKYIKQIDEHGNLKHDPSCRMIFIHAESSRDPLQITKKMLEFLFSWHQVWPKFVDFLYAFGDQLDAVDPYFAAFPIRRHYSPSHKAHAVPELGRQGLFFEMSYNLRFIDRKTNPPEWPWSIRQAAIHHSFDIKACKAFWVFVKGNSSIKDAIRDCLDSGETHGMSDFKNLSKALSSTLSIHSVVCERVPENWRWYINFIEGKVQSFTGKALTTRVNTKMNYKDDDDEKLLVRRESVPRRLDRQGTSKSQKIKKLGRSISFPFSPRPDEDQGLPNLSLSDQQKKNPIPTNPTAGWFSLNDLQDIQSVEERIDDALFALQMNNNHLQDLTTFYSSLCEDDDFPGSIDQELKSSIKRFGRQMTTIITDLRTHSSRLDILRTKCRERKTLLFAFLDHAHARISFLNAMESQISANKMESLTVEMSSTSKKTERETVFMRIITVVTLFFLPGTLISTLMSTDIVRFVSEDQSSPLKRKVSTEAIKLYITATLILMTIVFTISGLFKYWEDRKARKEKAKKSNDSGDP